MVSSLCHGGYCGYVTDASTEREWREDKEPCSPKASMGEYLGIRFNTIREKGREHRSKMLNQKTQNTFMKVLPPVKEVWDSVQELHPKTLLLSENWFNGQEGRLSRTVEDGCGGNFLFWTGRHPFAPQD